MKCWSEQAGERVMGPAARWKSRWGLAVGQRRAQACSCSVSRGIRKCEVEMHHWVAGKGHSGHQRQEEQNSRLASPEAAVCPYPVLMANGRDSVRTRPRMLVTSSETGPRKYGALWDDCPKGGSLKTHAVGRYVTECGLCKQIGQLLAKH